MDVLHRLYGTVIVPQQVITELTERWSLHLPDWIDVRVVVVNDTALLHLDPGERAAITLAQSEPGAPLLIDDAAGRIEASRRGILNTGTLGVLRAAARLHRASGHESRSLPRVHCQIDFATLVADATKVVTVAVQPWRQVSPALLALGFTVGEIN